MSNETTIKDQAKGINCHTAIFIALFHVGALAALLMFSSKALVSAIVLWWVALLTFGEGWHNNHHAYPTSAPWTRLVRNRSQLVGYSRDAISATGESHQTSQRD